MRVVKLKRAYIKSATICNKLDYLNGFPDDVITEMFGEAVRKSISEAKEKGQPVAMYDRSERKAYLEYPDGRRECVEK